MDALIIYKPPKSGNRCIIKIKKGEEHCSSPFYAAFKKQVIIVFSYIS